MLLSYLDLANFLNGCAPHDIAHHIFHLTRLLVAVRYLEDRLQSLFDCYKRLRDKRRAETEASNAWEERDVETSGENTTSETSVVAQLRAELSAAANFKHQLVLPNDDLTVRVNELVKEQEGIQHFIRDMVLERNAATKDFNSEQELRETLTEELKQCNYLKDQATQDYAAEHFKNAGLQDDLNDQHHIEIAAHILTPINSDKFIGIKPQTTT